MYTMTTINVQGDNQEAFEVYADDTREQTIAFCFSEQEAALIAAAPDLLAAAMGVVKTVTPDKLKGTVKTNFSEQVALSQLSKAVEAAKNLAR